MSLALKCDNCSDAIADFTLPQGFSDDGGTVVMVSVERGLASLDLCRACFAEILVAFACAVAPCGVTYERKAGWCKINEKPE